MASLENGRSRSRAGSKTLLDFGFNEIVKGNVPYPLNLLEEFATGEHSEENVQFYRNVENFKEEPVLDKRTEIVDVFVKPGAEKEINISSDSREEVMTRHSTETEPKDDIFNNAQKDIADLIKSDIFPRFERMVKETNLNDQTASQATALGLKFLFVAVVLTVVTFVLQTLCDPNSAADAPEFCSSIEILGNRFWRLLAGPFYMGAIMFILAGREKFCPICAASGTSLRYDKPKVTYFGIITRKVIPEYVIKVPEILSANRKKALRRALITMMLTIMIGVGMVLLPPDNPPFFT